LYLEQFESSGHRLAWTNRHGPHRASPGRPQRVEAEPIEGGLELSPHQGQGSSAAIPLGCRNEGLITQLGVTAEVGLGCGQLRPGGFDLDPCGGICKPGIGWVYANKGLTRLHAIAGLGEHFKHLASQL
jgi:hypothetical protein